MARRQESSPFESLMNALTQGQGMKALIEAPVTLSKQQIGSELSALNTAIEDAQGPDELTVLQSKVTEVTNKANRHSDTELLGIVSKNIYNRKQQQFTEATNALNEIDDMVHSSGAYEGKEFSDTTPEFRNNFDTWAETYKKEDPDNPLIYGLTKAFDDATRLFNKVIKVNAQGKPIGLKVKRKRGEGTISDEELVEKIFKYKERIGMGLKFAMGNEIITPDELDAIMQGGYETFKALADKNVETWKNVILSSESQVLKLQRDIAKLKDDPLGSALSAEMLKMAGLESPEIDPDDDPEAAMNKQAVIASTVKSKLEQLQADYTSQLAEAKGKYEYWGGYSWDKAKDETPSSLIDFGDDGSISGDDHLKGKLDQFADVDSYNEWMDLDDDEKIEYAKIIYGEDYTGDEDIKKINDNFRTMDSNYFVKFMAKADKIYALDAVRGAYGLTLVYDGTIGRIVDKEGTTWTNKMIDAVEKKPEHYDALIQQWKKNATPIKDGKVLPGYENVTVSVYADADGNIVRHKVNGRPVLVDSNKPPPSAALRPEKVTLKKLVDKFNVKTLWAGMTWDNFKKTIGKGLGKGAHLTAGYAAYSFVSGAVGNLAESVTGREFVNEVVQLSGGLVLQGAVGRKVYNKLINSLIKQHDIDIGIIKEGKITSPIKPDEVPTKRVKKPLKKKPLVKKSTVKMSKATSSKNMNKIMSGINKFKKARGIGWILKYGKKGMGKWFAWKIGVKMGLGAGATVVGSFFSGGTATFALSAASYALIAYDMYQLYNVLVDAHNNDWK